MNSVYSVCVVVHGYMTNTMKKTMAKVQIAILKRKKEKILSELREIERIKEERMMRFELIKEEPRNFLILTIYKSCSSDFEFSSLDNFKEILDSRFDVRIAKENFDALQIREGSFSYTNDKGQIVKIINLRH